MPRLMRALARVLLLALLLLGAALAPLALLPIVVRWPARREHSILELARAEDAPVCPTTRLECR